MSPDGAQDSLSRFVSLITLVAPVPVESERIASGTHLVDDLGLDSIMQVALMALAEEHFGIALSDHPTELMAIQTVGDAVGLIDRIGAR